MSAQYDSPQFWKSLYQRPQDSNTEVEAGSQLVFEDGDLVANIEAAQAESELDLGAGIDANQLESLVSRLVAERIAAGGYVQAGGGASEVSGGAPQPSANPIKRKPSKQEPVSPRPAPEVATGAKAHVVPAPPSAEPPAAPPAAPDPWARVPYLPGGQTSIIGVGGLDPMAPMVLVGMDGRTSLRDLHESAPGVSEDAFIAIVRDALKRGLVAFK